MKKTLINKIFIGFIFLSLLSGCAAKKTEPVLPAPMPPVNKTTSPVKEKTSIFYGSYKEDMLFRAIVINEQDGFRVVLLSDDGLMLQDMKIRPEGESDVYYYIAYMPKETVKEFVLFFQEYYFVAEKENIKKFKSRTYFYKDNNPVLWIKQI